MDPDWRTRSQWLASDPYRPNPPLDGTVRADVGIVGGGFTGLWTAYFLKQADPSLEVAVMEREVVGYGGSGRNAGFAMTVLDNSLHHLVQNHGIDRAREAHSAVARAVHGIGEWAEKHGVDIEYERSGFLGVATDEGQAARVRQDVVAAEALGLEDVRFLSGPEVREEVDSPRFVCAFLEETCAVLNPARLVRGLKGVVEGMGVRVFEGTPLRHLDRGARIRLHGDRGTVEATHAVLAMNPWSFQVPSIGLRSLPIYTYIVLTEPLTDRQLASVGWGNRRGWESKRNYLDYVRLTSDNRILWGGEAMYFYGPGIGPKYDRHEQAFRSIEREFRSVFPQLQDVRIAERWGGPIAVTARFIPSFGTLPDGGIHYGFGYSGHGVAPSHLGGEILRDLVLGRDSELTSLVLVEEAKQFPPEPLASLGASASRAALKAQDRRMARGEEVGSLRPWLLRVIDKLS